MSALRVLSYNLHKGFTPGNRRFVLAQMRAAIRAQQPDLVLLQEVQDQHAGHAVRHAEWPAEGQFAYLAEHLWPHRAYGRNAVYADGHHGNAVLSRFPILAVENLDISTNRFESRGLLHAQVAVPGLATPLHVLCCHLNLLHRGRLAQVEVIARRLAAAVPVDHALVLAGDFNDWSARLSHRLEQVLALTDAHRRVHGRLARTFPARMPLFPLDRIYVRGLHPTASAVLRGPPWSTLSDHLALQVECSATAPP